MARTGDVVVGVDGSAESDAAVAWAVAEAGVRNCCLVAVHACESRYYGLWTTTRTLREGLRQMARPIVDDALALAASIDPGVPSRGGVLVASPVRTLVRLSHSAGIVVIGRSGRGAISRLLLGSVARSVMAEAAAPVVAVGCPPDDTSPPRLARVVAAVADPAVNPESLQFAFAEAQRWDVPLRIVHASRAGRPLAGQDLIPWQSAYPGVHMTTSTHTDSLTDALVATCTSRDLVVLGHHRHLPTRHALGPHVMSVLHAAPCPVAVVPEPPGATVTDLAPAIAEGAPA